MHLTVKSACWHLSISWGSAPPSGFNSVGWKLELPSSCKKSVQEKQSKSKNILKLVIINRQRNIDTTKAAQLIQLQELRSHFRMVLMGHEAALCRCGSVFIIAGSGSNLNTCWGRGSLTANLLSHCFFLWGGHEGWGAQPLSLLGSCCLSKHLLFLLRKMWVQWINCNVSLSHLITPLFCSRNSFIISVLVPLNLFVFSNSAVLCYHCILLCQAVHYLRENCFRYPSCEVHPDHVINGLLLQKFLMKTFKTDHRYSRKQKVKVIFCMR